MGTAVAENQKNSVGFLELEILVAHRKGVPFIFHLRLYLCPLYFWVLSKLTLDKLKDNISLQIDIAVILLAPGDALMEWADI